MGLDIHISTDKDDVLFDGDYFKNEEYYKHQLSRTFCNFMSRRNVISTEPELDQIGRLTGIDILPLYEMESYPHEEALEFELLTADSEEEKERILGRAKDDARRVQGNLEKTLATVDTLIQKLGQIERLADHLKVPDADVLSVQEYFSDFHTDKGDGYIGNNFGQDLRNFQRFLQFAKSKGVTTVYFVYG
jgi:hypothetical protein